MNTPANDVIESLLTLAIEAASLQVKVLWQRICYVEARKR